MKKKLLLKEGGDENPFRKMWSIMRLCVVLCFLIAMNVSAKGYSQHNKVSLNLTDVTLEDFIEAVKRQTGVSFVYNSSLFECTDKISVEVKKEPLDRVLESILGTRGFVFDYGDEVVVIRKGKEVVTVPQKEEKKVVIKGVVKDASGPLPGVNVVEKGTTNVVVTDVDGNFSLEVSPNAVLLFSFVGYQSQTIAVNNRKTLSVNMVEESEILEEVVIVGYGVQRKVNLTGSVAQVSSSELTDRPITNISSGLQGLMPGVTVIAGEGRPGQDGSTIRIRGVGTLNNANPYILIDGVEGSSINEVDPNDIENISVLKDAASAAIYGSKASNGVILITTKRGKVGDPHVTYNGYIGISNPTAIIDRISSADYARLYNRIDENNGRPHRYSDEDIRLFEDGSDPFGHPNTNWIDAAFRTGVIHKHNVNITGGSEKVKYMASAGYLGQSGILPHSERKQFNVRTNLDMDITKRLAVRLNMAYIKNDFKDPNTNYAGGWSNQIIRWVNNLSPMIPIYNEDGTYGHTTDGNPIAWLESGQTVDNYNKNFTGQLAVDYTIFKDLKATISGSYANNDRHNKAFVKKINNDPVQVNRPSSLTESFTNWTRYNLDLLLNYDKTFGQHNLKAIAGYHAEKFDTRSNGMYRENFPNNELDDMNAGTEATQTNNGNTRELAMISYFGRVNYDYAGKYLFEANIRADASSRFAPKYRWGYFPSFSGAWRISEERFMKNAKNWLSNLKIRGSWGMLGNQNAIGGDYYPWMNVYNLGANYPFGGSLVTGYYQANYKIEDISWEKSTNWGIGLEALICNKINLEIEYYDRRTTDIIMTVPVPDEFALGAYQDNVGAMRNRGVEIQLGYKNQWNNWEFSATGNFSYNKNKIENLGGVDRMPQGAFMYQIGSPINSWYVYRTNGFFQSDEEAKAFEDKYGNPFGKHFRGGDLIYIDCNKDGRLTAEDRELYKTTDPVMTFGLNLNAAYKNIDLTMNFTGVAKVGNFFSFQAFGEFNGDTGHPSTAWLDSWTPENKNASMPRVADRNESPSSPMTVMSDFWIVNTSYLRLKNLQLGYTFPKNLLERIGIRNLRVYYSAENVLTFDSMPIDVDPETHISQASDYPLSKTHSLGINITF